MDRQFLDVHFRHLREELSLRECAIDPRVPEAIADDLLTLPMSQSIYIPFCKNVLNVREPDFFITYLRFA